MKGLCIGVPEAADYPLFLRVVEEVLPAAGYDTLVLLVRYQFPVRSHPTVATANTLAPEQLRGIAAAKTLPGKCRRTSSATWAEKFVRPSNIVSSTPNTESPGFSRRFTARSVVIKSESPSNA